MSALTGKIAAVTGTSRGVGKGIALALGAQGCTVYVTGRTTGSGERSIDTTARLVTEAGGVGRAIRCDPDPPAWGGGFWDHPIHVWDDQVGIGLRAHYVASWHAALLTARDLMARGGTVQWVEDLAEEFGIVDENGKRPPGYPQRVAARR